MSQKLPSLKRVVILSFVFLALLGSLLWLQAGEEMEFSCRIGSALSSALEYWGSCAQGVRLPLSWNGEPSSGYQLQPPSETSAQARSNSSVSNTTLSSSTPVLQALEFNSSASSSLFRTWGALTIGGGSTLPYAILNATLWAGDRPVEGTRYMMMELEPGSCRDFDIRKVCRLAPEENYSCLLEVEGPEGLLELEGGYGAVRQGCQVAEDDPRLVIWDETAGCGREINPEEEYVDAFSTASSQGVDGEVESSSEDLKSEDLDLRSDSSTVDEKKAEPSVGADYEGSEIEIETDYEDREAGDVYYVGSTSSDKYHRPDCSYAKKIKPENRRIFSDVWEAREAGYSPCGVCKPP